MPRLVTLRQVAEVLGVSGRKVRNDIASGLFGPAVVRLGRAVRIREAELTAWVEAGCPNRDTWKGRFAG